MIDYTKELALGLDLRLLELPYLLPIFLIRMKTNT